MQSHFTAMEGAMVDLRIYIVYIDKVCVDNAGTYWSGQTIVQWSDTETRVVQVQVEPRYYGRVRVLRGGTYTLLAAAKDALQRECPRLQVGDEIVCTLLGYQWGFKAGAWACAKEIQTAIDSAHSELSPSTSVRVLRREKQWNHQVHGWVDAPIAIARHFEGTLEELCARYPQRRPAFEPIDSDRVRVRYSFLLLTPNDGWQSIEDPRSRMRRADATDQ